MLDNDFTTVDFIFKDIMNANKCLDMDYKKDRVVMYIITNRTVQSKELITTWDGTITDLIEANKKQFTKLERLRRVMKEGGERRINEKQQNI